MAEGRGAGERQHAREERGIGEERMRKIKLHLSMTKTEHRQTIQRIAFYVILEVCAPTKALTTVQSKYLYCILKFYNICNIYVIYTHVCEIYICQIQIFLSVIQTFLPD